MSVRNHSGLGGDSPPEEVIEWGNEHLNADKVDAGDSDIPAPGEVSREKQDDE